MHDYMYSLNNNSLVVTLAGLWSKAAKNTIKTRVFYLPKQHNYVFKEKYDQVQIQLQYIAAMDDLMSGSYYICMMLFM